MDQVIAADGGAVAVAREDDHMQFGVCHLNAGSEGDGAAVRCVDRVEVKVARRAGRAADAGHNNNILAVDAVFLVVD